MREQRKGLKEKRPTRVALVMLGKYTKLPSGSLLLEDITLNAEGHMAEGQVVNGGWKLSVARPEGIPINMTSQCDGYMEPMEPYVEVMVPNALRRNSDQILLWAERLVAADPVLFANLLPKTGVTT